MNIMSLKNLCISCALIGCTFQLSAHWSESLTQGMQLVAQGVSEAAQSAGSTIASSAKNIAAEASRRYQELVPVLKASKEKLAAQSLELAKKLSEKAQQLKDTRAAQVILAGLAQAKTFSEKHPVACIAAIWTTLAATSMIYGAWQHHKQQVAWQRKLEQEQLEQAKRNLEEADFGYYYPPTTGTITPSPMICN